MAITNNEKKKKRKKRELNHRKRAKQLEQERLQAEKVKKNMAECAARAVPSAAAFKYNGTRKVKPHKFREKLEKAERMEERKKNSSAP